MARGRMSGPLIWWAGLHSCLAELYVAGVAITYHRVMKQSATSEGGSGEMPSQSSSAQLIDTSLYRRMTVVMHTVIFLYSAAFWIQVGVLPVRQV